MKCGIMSSDEAKHSLMTYARISVLHYGIMSSDEAKRSLMTYLLWYNVIRRSKA